MVTNPYEPPAEHATEEPELPRGRTLFSELRWAIELVVMVGVIMFLATAVVLAVTAIAFFFS